MEPVFFSIFQDETSVAATTSDTKHNTLDFWPDDWLNNKEGFRMIKFTKIGKVGMTSCRFESRFDLAS